MYIDKVLTRSSKWLSPKSQICTAIETSHILLILSIFNKSSRIVLTKKRLRRNLAKILNSLKINVNNWLTHDLFTYMCKEADMCDGPTKQNKVTVIVRNGTALKFAVLLHLTGLLDMVRFMDRENRKFPIYALLAGMGMLLDELSLQNVYK